MHVLLTYPFSRSGVLNAGRRRHNRWVPQNVSQMPGSYLCRVHCHVLTNYPAEFHAYYHALSVVEMHPLTMLRCHVLVRRHGTNHDLALPDMRERSGLEGAHYRRVCSIFHPSILLDPFRPRFFCEILKMTSDAVDDVIVEADGQWYTSDKKYFSTYGAKTNGSLACRGPQYIDLV